MWLRSTIPFLIALISGLVWMLFLYPVLLRLFDVPTHLGFGKWKRLEVDRGQTDLWDLIGWGVYFIICHAARVYIRWRMYGHPSDKPTMLGITEWVLWCAVMVAVICLIIAFIRKDKTITLNLSQPPDRHP
jgi:hypothetical protein